MISQEAQDLSALSPRDIGLIFKPVAPDVLVARMGALDKAPPGYHYVVATQAINMLLYDGENTDNLVDTINQQGPEGIIRIVDYIWKYGDKNSGRGDAIVKLAETISEKCDTPDHELSVISLMFNHFFKKFKDEGGKIDSGTQLFTLTKRLGKMKLCLLNSEVLETEKVKEKPKIVNEEERESPPVQAKNVPLNSVRAIVFRFLKLAR